MSTSFAIHKQQFRDKTAEIKSQYKQAVLNLRRARDLAVVDAPDQRVVILKQYSLDYQRLKLQRQTDLLSAQQVLLEALTISVKQQ